MRASATARVAGTATGLALPATNWHAKSPGYSRHIGPIFLWSGTPPMSASVVNPPAEWAEHADALRIDGRMPFPGGPHVVDHATDLPRPVHDVDAAAVVGVVVARVVHGHHDEARIGQGNGGVEMSEAGTTRAMGDHDHRHGLAVQGRVHGDAHRRRPHGHRIGDGLAWIPDADRDGLASGVGGRAAMGPFETPARALQLLMIGVSDSPLLAGGVSPAPRLSTY
jgi:hypothetical protein